MIKETTKGQLLVYYVSKALHDSELNYSKIEKLAYSLARTGTIDYVSFRLYIGLPSKKALFLLEKKSILIKRDHRPN